MNSTNPVHTFSKSNAVRTRPVKNTAVASIVQNVGPILFLITECAKDMGDPKVATNESKRTVMKRMSVGECSAFVVRYTNRLHPFTVKLVVMRKKMKQDKTTSSLSE